MKKAEFSWLFLAKKDEYDGSMVRGTFVEVHVSVDVREGAEVLVAVSAAVHGPAVRQHGGLKHKNC